MTGVAENTIHRQAPGTPRRSLLYVPGRETARPVGAARSESQQTYTRKIVPGGLAKLGQQMEIGQSVVIPVDRSGSSRDSCAPGVSMHGRKRLRTRQRRGRGLLRRQTPTSQTDPLLARPRV